jgi:hypothetical protein
MRNGPNPARVEPMGLSGSATPYLGRWFRSSCQMKTGLNLPPLCCGYVRNVRALPRYPNYRRPTRRTSCAMGYNLLSLRSLTFIDTAGTPRPAGASTSSANTFESPRGASSSQTIANASQAFGNHRQIQSSTSLSIEDSLGRFGLRRCRTLTCCRRARISASRLARDRNRSAIIASGHPPSTTGSPDSLPTANWIQFTTGTAPSDRRLLAVASSGATTFSS